MVELAGEAMTKECEDFADASIGLTMNVKERCEREM